MRNVFHILRRDLLRILKTPAVWIVVLFLLVLPSLYSWFNVYAFWDPYENTSNLRVCVVNEDAGVDDETLGKLDVGQMVIDELEQDDRLGWEFTTRDDALEQVSSGEAYAAFIIPKTFSADLATIVTDEFTQPRIEYYVNEKKNAVSPKITDTGAGTLDTTINDEFVGTASNVIAAKLNDVLKKADNELEDAKGTASSKLAKARDEAAAAREALATLASSARDASAKASQAKQELASAKNQITNLESGLNRAGQGASSASTAVARFSTTMATASDEGASFMAKAAANASLAVSKAYDALSVAHGKVDAGIERAQGVLDETDGVITSLQGVVATLDQGRTRDQLEGILAELEEQRSGTSKTLAQLETLSDDIADLGESAKDTAGSAGNAASNALEQLGSYRKTLSGTTLPTLETALADASSTLTELAGIAGKSTALVDQTSALLDQLSSTLSVSADALSSSDSLLATLQGDLDGALNDLSALGKLSIEGEIDPNELAAFMVSPTTVTTEELYPLNAYGSAMAPLFINLTLWIGVFMLLVIIRTEVDKENLRPTTSPQRYLARWILLAALAALQAVICCTGCLIIGVQTASAPLFYLTAIIASLTYLSIQYMLAKTMQHVGKGICIVLIFAQIPGATGLYPIEMTPGFFQAVYPLFPFTYGINAMRETICGFYGNAWIGCIATLLAFLAAFMFIGILLKPQIANLNRMTSEQLEQSDLINSKSVETPERRFRAGQLIALLASRSVYRELVMQRMRRFEALRPLIMRLAIAVSFAVPVIAGIVFAAVGGEKVVLLTLWLVWLLIVITFFVLAEYFRDHIARQIALEEMSDDEVRALYAHAPTQPEQAREEADR